MGAKVETNRKRRRLRAEGTKVRGHLLNLLNHLEMQEQERQGQIVVGEAGAEWKEPQPLAPRMWGTQGTNAGLIRSCAKQTEPDYKRTIAKDQTSNHKASMGAKAR